MRRGKVTWFNADKGYGFIKSQGIGDVFVHWSAIEMDGYKMLKDGEEVTFDVERGDDGRPKAVHVRRQVA